MDMIELAERCERGSGPDRELDCLIGVVTDVQVEGTVHSWRNLVNSFGIEWAVDAAERYNSIFRTELPRYTASLDASVALLERVLPGWRVAEMKDGIPHEDGPYCHVRLWCPANSALGYKFPANASSPARALLAAILRALAAKDETP